jgi:CheY-like chemotaxis protein
LTYIFISWLFGRLSENVAPLLSILFTVFLLHIKEGTRANWITVDTFNDPVLALSNFKADCYGLILLDVKMLQMNGFELYYEVKKKTRK